MPSDAVVEGVSGAIGGCVATIATYPLMTVTTWQATRIKSTSTTIPLPPPRTTISELIHAVQTNGWASLFPGISASLLGTTISQGVYFFLYSLLRDSALARRRNNNNRNNGSSSMTVPESIMVASLAGWGNVLLTNPIWMIATRMQAHQRRPTIMKTTTVSNSNSNNGNNIVGPPTNLLGSYNNNNSSTSSSGSGKDEEQGTGGTKKEEITPDIGTTSRSRSSRSNSGGSSSYAAPPGLIAVARQVYVEYGLGGFWNGCGASLVMVINPTLQYALYEWLTSVRDRVRRRKGSGAINRPGVMEVFMMSAIAKTGATLVTYPLMTIKTRMMSARKEADCEMMQYKSIGDAIVKIGSREGVGGYYQGIRTKIVQSVLAAALLLMLKEKITDATKAMLLERKRNHGLK